MKNLGNLLKQAQEMQTKMAEMQAELERLEVTGSSGGGNIDINLTGDIRGGSGTGAGLWIDGGAVNTVNTTRSLSAISGLAVRGGAGDDTINNSGLVAGNLTGTRDTLSTFRWADNGRLSVTRLPVRSTQSEGRCR